MEQQTAIKQACFFREKMMTHILTEEDGLANLWLGTALHDHRQPLFFQPHHPNYKVFSSMMHIQRN
jgi:hypothetical protein